MIPVRLLFEGAQNIKVTLSADGRGIYYLKNNRNLIYRDIEMNKETEVCILDKKIMIYEFLSQDSLYYLYDSNSSGLDTIVVVRNGNSHTLQMLDRKIRVLQYSSSKNTLAFSANRKNSAIYDIYIWDLNSFKYNIIFENNENAFKWELNDQNEIIAKYMNVGNKILLLMKINGNWIGIREYWSADYWRSCLICWDDEAVYLKERGERDTFSIIKVSLTDFHEEVIVSLEFDIEDVLVLNQTIAAVSFYSIRKKWIILHEDDRYELEFLTDETDGDIQFVQFSDNENAALLVYTRDNDVKSYYSYTRAVDGKSHKKTLLFKSRDSLREYTLDRTKGFSFWTRDDITIEGYMTAKTFQERTLVMKIHGGPLQRDSWGYDAIAQFFSSRDCICCEINYRGSFGYGKKFEELMNKELGGKVTNDICDGVEYMLAQFEQIEYVYLYGWSSGGYIALMTAINHRIPYLKGIIAVSAPLDIRQFVENSEENGVQTAEMAGIIFGNPEKDIDVMRDQSALREEIGYPLLYAYGSCDLGMDEKRIKMFQSMNGSDCTILKYQDGHALTRSRIDLFEHIEKFVSDKT